MYQLLNQNRYDGFLKRIDGENIVTLIPFDEANTDYQEYLKWLEQGNTPLPADNNK